MPLHLPCRLYRIAQWTTFDSQALYRRWTTKSYAESHHLAPRHQRRSPRPFLHLPDSIIYIWPRSALILNSSRGAYAPHESSTPSWRHLQALVSSRPGVQGTGINPCAKSQSQLTSILCITLNHSRLSSSCGEAVVAPLRVWVWLRKVSTCCWMRNGGSLICGT